MVAAGRQRSLALTGPHRSWGVRTLRRSPRIARALPRSPAFPAAKEDPPTSLRVGDEVEVRLDGNGFFGTWYEATVVGLDHARGRSEPRYTVAYSRVRPDDGAGLPKRFASTQIRPRPPTPPATSSPPRFLVHDIVEALDRGGWWSGIVVAAADGPAGGGAAVTVAFPITGEVMSFAPHSVRRRRDYVDGEWVPSRAVVAEESQPKRELRVYHVGEKVEVWKNREVYGYSWFAATVAMVVDRFSYILEYPEQEGEKATDYLCWDCIRPAIDRSPGVGKFKLVPGAALEAYCDGAWTPGALNRIVGEDEYEVRVNKGVASRMVTRVVELLKPHYRWDGNRWSIVKPKKMSKLYQKARKELQQEVIQVSKETNNVSRSKMTVYVRKLKIREARLKEPETPERKKAAGVDTPSNQLHKGLATTTNSICQVTSNEDVLTDNTATQEANNSHIMETLTVYPNQHDGGNVNEKSIVLDLQNAGSSQCITETNILCAGSSLPSNLSPSQISICHQAVFEKTSDLWAVFEAMDVFKNVPQQPHFRPLQKCERLLREGTAIGLMQTFVNSVHVIRKLSLADSMDSIEEIRSGLLLLKDNGFNVEYLQKYLDILVKIKTDNTRHLEDKANLEAQILKNMNSSSKIDLLLVENDKAIAELEKNLSERRCKGQKIAKDKEHSDAELSRLKAAHSNVDEACRDDKQQFCSVLAELERQHLT